MWPTKVLHTLDLYPHITWKCLLTYLHSDTWTHDHKCITNMPCVSHTHILKYMHINTCIRYTSSHMSTYPGNKVTHTVNIYTALKYTQTWLQHHIHTANRQMNQGTQTFCPPSLCLELSLHIQVHSDTQTLTTIYIVHVHMFSYIHIPGI